MASTTEETSYTYRWFINRFEEAKKRSVAFCRPIPTDLFLRRPAENVWCIGECYSHLNAFGEQYLRQIRGGVGKAGNMTVPDSGHPFTLRLLVKWVVWLYAPPYKMKMKTLKPFHPQSKADLDKDRVLEEYLDLQDALISEIRQAETARIDLDRIKVRNPLLRFIRMRLSECFAVVEVHQRRHMWQAEQILHQLQ